MFGTYFLRQEGLWSRLRGTLLYFLNLAKKMIKLGSAIVANNKEIKRLLFSFHFRAKDVITIA